MEPWIAATLAGLCLGLSLYACVRLRMYLGPRIRERFGNGARRAYWAATIVAMIVLANFALITLRSWMPPAENASTHLMPEIWFLIVAVAIAFGLIFVKVTSRK